MEIQIERLTAGTLIFRKDDADFGRYGDFAEVQDVEFDGHSYTVTALLQETDGATDWIGDTEVPFTVEPGSTISFGGRGMPFLRDAADVGADELRAKIEANNAATMAMIANANARCADMRGEALVAAE